MTLELVHSLHRLPRMEHHFIFTWQLSPRDLMDGEHFNLAVRVVVPLLMRKVLSNQQFEWLGNAFLAQQILHLIIPDHKQECINVVTLGEILDLSVLEKDHLPSTDIFDGHLLSPKC